MTTFDRVREVIAEQLGIDSAKITEDARLIEDLKADSIEVAEMLYLIEEEFSISLDEENVLKLRTPGDVAKLIDQLSK